MDRILDREGNGYRLCILGDLNGWIGDRTTRENDNGRRVVELCSERGLCIGNTYFEQRSLHENTWVVRGQEHDRSDTGEEGYAVVCAG